MNLIYFLGLVILASVGAQEEGLEIDGDAPQRVKADLLRSRTCYPVILLLLSWRMGTGHT